jgi:hypothetical protein
MATIANQAEVDPGAVARVAAPGRSDHDWIDAEALPCPLEAAHLARIDPADGTRDSGDYVEHAEGVGGP